MSGEEELPEPININERKGPETFSLRKPFQYSVEDFVKSYRSYGNRGWLSEFPAEAKIDWGHISQDGDIMPELEISEKVGIPFVKVNIEGILQFTDIANDSDLSDDKGIEAYMGLAVARSFIAYAREYRFIETRTKNHDGKEKITRGSVFNDELLNGFDARASLHSTISNSRFSETLLEGLSLQFMSDKTVTNLQAYRAMFGLMYNSHDTKYLEMMNAFDSHFNEEVADQEAHRQKIQALVDNRHIDQKVYRRWIADSFTDVWFAAVHPFDEEEIEALLG